MPSSATNSCFICFKSFSPLRGFIILNRTISSELWRICFPHKRLVKTFVWDDLWLCEQDTMSCYAAYVYLYIYIYHLVCILINIWTADWAKQLSEAIVPSLALRSHPESNMNFTSESYKRKFPFFQRVPCLSGVFVISAYGYQEFMFPTSWTSFVSGSDSRRPEGMMWTCHSLTRLDTRENCPDMIFRWGRSLIEDPFPATC